jgi:hypothetical protein
LTVNNIPFSYKGKTVLTVDTATVSYSEKAPEPACGDVTGTEVWCGSWQVELPQATIVTGVSSSGAFADGSFAFAKVTVTGNVPLLYGVVLTQLTGSVTLNPPDPLTGQSHNRTGRAVAAQLAVRTLMESCALAGR